MDGGDGYLNLVNELMQKQGSLGVVLFFDEGYDLLVVDDEFALIFVVVVGEKLRFIEGFCGVECFAFGMAVVMIRGLSLSFGSHPQYKVSIDYNLN